MNTNKKPVRVRMAPSPTGEYHIGHIRTVLYNWAYARQNEAKFIIRIEDTDRARLVEGAVERILSVIKDYGLNWDEGPDVGGPFGPYIQSERLSIYQKYISELIDKGNAYYCFCTEERLSEMREEQKKKGVKATKYDRHCLALSHEEIEKKLQNKEPHVIRLKVPDNQTVEFEDVVYGKISFDTNTIDDQVLIKSDGFPTYHFAVVVDDHLMEITHVMRGNDWLPSTPKHVLLYRAFNWEMPVHIHLPNLKELGGVKKLSKRFGAVFAREFLEEGYLPEALLNFLMFLGWNPGTEKEIYSLDEFTHDFDIKKIHKTDLVAFDRKKLEWLNGQYIKSLSDDVLAKKLLDFAPKELNEEKLVAIIPLVKDRIKKLSEFAGIAGFFVNKRTPDNSDFSQNAKAHLLSAKEVLANLKTFDLENLTASFMEEINNNQFKTGEFFMDLRIAITGQKVSPPINESIIILGKDETITRITDTITSLAS